jgi:predicted permease
VIFLSSVLEVVDRNLGAALTKQGFCWHMFGAFLFEDRKRQTKGFLASSMVSFFQFLY